jgi:MazG family protein
MWRHRSQVKERPIMTESESFEGLVAIMDRLRGPDGCPWDREQTWKSLRRFLLEECYEVADALDRADPDELREELGDLLFQIVFLSRLAKEEGQFTADDVVRGIAEKMIRRHPHVFGEDRAETSDEVLRRWEEIKRRERKAGSEGEGEGHRSILDGIPRALPAMMKAQQMGARAARVGFDWNREIDILEKIDEELEELRSAVASSDRSQVEEELGDFLFATVMLARRLQIDPEAALERTNLKFRERFGKIEDELSRRGVAVETAGLELMDQLWDETKT